VRVVERLPCAARRKSKEDALKQSRRYSFLCTLALALVLVLAAGSGPAGVASAAAPDLFFSEYIEGSSNNKALEIYNGTGAPVDLTGYTVEQYSNGGTTTSVELDLSGTLADGDVYVVAHSSSDPAILAEADQTTGAGLYNGDDALVLVNGGTVVDSIGQVGFDPGSQWGSGDTSTADNTLRRMAGVCEGDTNPDDAFDPAAEWDGFPQDTFDGLGSHTASCNGSGTPTVVRLSEIRIDQPSTDNDEYFELEGTPGSSLDGLTYLVIGDGAAAAGSGVVEAVIDLSGQVIPDSGFFVAAESTFTLGTANLTANLNFENSDNVTHLLVRDFSGSDGDDLDADDDGELDSIPWSEQVGCVSLVTASASEQIYCDTTLGPDGSFVPGLAIYCGSDWRIGAFDPSAGEDTPGAANHCPVIADDAKLSEIRVDQSGADNDEYFELTGTPGGSLDGLTYLVIGDDSSGSSGSIEAVVNLNGQTIPSSGFFVAAESTFSLGTADLITTLDFENNDNVTHLLVRDFSGSNGNDLDTDDDGELDSAPWSGVVDCAALVNADAGGNQVYCDTTVGPDGNFLPGHVYLCDDGWRIGPFSPGDDTPGEANACDNGGGGDPGLCGDPFTPIYEIQGSGTASPIEGQVVSTEGVVVGDFQPGDGDQFNSDLGGFYIQDPAGDGNTATSDGIFVFAPSSQDVAVGDTVRVRGEVDEFFNLTELTDVSSVQVCGTGSVAPVALSLPVDSIGDFEQYEGMLVTFPQELHISEYFNFDRFGEVVLTAERQFQPTAVAEPGSPEAEAIALANELGRITLDDARSIENPDPARHPNGNVFDLTNLFRGGDTVSNVTGVLSYDFGLYRIQPTTGADYESENPRPATHDEVGGRLEVASFNVLNYFTTLGSRGADTPEEFERQHDKIVAAISEINADVVGLIEIENNDAAIANLVDGLNDVMGAGTYAYIDTGVIGTDEIKVALIYKPATVSPVGDYAILDSSEHPLFDDTRNRPMLTQSFEENATGEVVTVSVNHLKSKGSACGPGDDDPVQGNCNVTRTEAAQAIVEWLATDPTNSGDPDHLIIGDLNAYDKEDPIDVLVNNGYTDLVLKYEGEYAYSYVFDGQLGYLDHALANESLVSQVTGATVWNINADEPDLIDYDMTFKQDPQDELYEPNAYRSSDHDPVIVGLDLDSNAAPVCEAAVPSESTLWPPNHQFVSIEILDVTDPDGDSFTINIDSIFQDEAVDAPDSGNTAPDGQGVGTSTAEVRAERVGTADGRVYHITFTATDDSGASCSGTVQVGVPVGRKDTPVDNGPLYDSTATP
jgi:predicted extracellular nuclease